MPLGLHPDDIAEFTLPAHEHLPEAARPIFRSRYLTVRQASRVRELVERANKAADAEANDLLSEALAIGLVGWENVYNDQREVVPFSVEVRDSRKLITALDDVLTFVEKMKMAYQYPARVSAMEWDLKKAPASPTQSASA